MANLMSMKKICTTQFFLAGNLADIDAPHEAKEARPDERALARKAGTVLAGIR
jgi:hypothetical protein